MTAVTSGLSRAMRLALLGWVLLAGLASPIDVHAQTPQASAQTSQTPAQTSQSPLVVGTAVERVLRLDGKQVPLPAGSWVVAADAASDWTDPNLGSFGYLRSVVLFRIVDGRIDTMLEVNSNALPTTDGWGMASNCGRADLVLAVVRYRAGWDGSCYFVTHTLMTKEPTPAWRQARDFATAKGWQASRIWLTAGFRSANRSDVLDVRYHFAPETRGIGTESVERWQDSAWMSAKLDNDPNRYAFARAVSDWAVAYSALVDAGLKNRLLNDDVPLMPAVGNTAPAADVIARRLAELEILRQAGTITAAEYAAQAQALKEHGLASSSTALDLSAVTTVKAISYRIIVSISHIFVDYYWTGNYVAAGALEVLQITINSMKFYFHELGWAKYMGIPRSDAARTIDFKYVGVDV
jgi:uncharacterized membrane protein